MLDQRKHSTPFAFTLCMYKKLPAMFWLQSKMSKYKLRQNIHLLNVQNNTHTQQCR